jgi:hypothetical protein
VKLGCGYLLARDEAGRFWLVLLCPLPPPLEVQRFPIY